MGMSFTNRFTQNDAMNMALVALGIKLSPEETYRLNSYKERWNFYEGFHWEDVQDDGDSPQVTENYCRAFVNKLVAFEFGKGFSIKMLPEVEPKVLPFLNDVWDNMNGKEQFCTEYGQNKSVTGDGWVQVKYIPPTLTSKGSTIDNPEFDDPYGEFPDGIIKIVPISSSIAFPEYDEHNKSRLIRLTIMYPIRVNPRMSNNQTRTYVYKQVWTRKTVKVYHGKDLKGEYNNKYGVIPFFHTKNLPIAGKSSGQSDLEDVIPLNMELNLKKSDVSEIIDYHSAPVTVLFGTRVGNLERGNNKVWGGLPKDSRVENLRLEGELDASVSYIDGIKQAMHEVGNVPEGALGKEMAISNTSGVALEVQMMPLTERIKQKRAQTGETLSQINKLLIKIGIEEGLIYDADGEAVDVSSIKPRQLYKNEILFEDVLPKDGLVELQKLQLEMKLGLCDREEGMKRLGKKDIQQRIKEIDEDRDKYPEVYGVITQLEIDKQEADIEKTKADIETSKVQKVNLQRQGLNIMQRPLGENKEGKDGEVNAGLQNSPKKKPKAD